MRRFRPAAFAAFLASMTPGVLSHTAAKAQDLYSGGGTVYVPYAGGGGFMPYTPGPGGGLGVQGPGGRPMIRPSAASTLQGMGRGAGGSDMASGLGGLRSTLSPLTPIRSGGKGMGGSLVQRRPAGGGMAEPPRPPVGYYPFRRPADGSGQASGMGMQ
jgi:hypothetical protein